MIKYICDWCEEEFFDEEVKKILQEKIDRLVEAKNNFKL